MKNKALLMSICMGLTMSFVLSLIGNISSGNFTVPGFLMGFAISFIISMLIGLIIPMRKISGIIIEKLSVKPGTVTARVIESLTSSILYTPLMTFVMVFRAYRMAVAHGAKIVFLPMYLRSLGISLIAGFLLSFFISPVYNRLIFGKIPARKQ